jgi:hypothetical protein
VQSQPDSFRQLASQPSRLVVLPSSQVSPRFNTPFPQVWTQTLGSP